ncbi:MAG: IS630 family transposase [Mycolicibacterium sp.]|nr:IS630 family transposase [Mycolicibacterium sp.]
MTVPIQALDRTQPSLPMKPGRAGTMTHDYRRNGTIDLFAAMDVATGEVLTELRKGHAGADVLGFFKQIDAAVPRDLEVHVILDNLSAHSTPEIRKWLAHKNRRRWHLHFTPTSSSWLNLIERWFKELTDKRLRRGAFTSVADLSAASPNGPNTGTSITFLDCFHCQNCLIKPPICHGCSP